MTKTFLQKTYGLTGTDAVRNHYNAWAISYDTEVAGNGYATPERCARALVGTGLPTRAPILDLGCGTGLGGLALRVQGFTVIDGTDLSPGMLEQAAKRGVYRTLFPATDGAPDIAPGTYDAVTAIGVIGSGAAPVHLLDIGMGVLAPGGRFAFSFNDHTLDIPDFTDHVRGWLTAGTAHVMFKEHGPHLPGINLGSTVYVLEKA
ncbi:MAG: class I SAM-dependent methyltransferase [Rhodobacteraceae bacterium]|nr:class I SAM-dependent methyltransferase [Paracoccaceae bacterium]